MSDKLRFVFFKKKTLSAFIFLCAVKSGSAAPSKCSAAIKKGKVLEALKSRVHKALKAYDKDALLRIAQEKDVDIHEVNRAIQEAIVEYGKKNAPKKPERLLVGAGTATAILSATLREKMPEKERLNMVILESTDHAVDNFYGKNFTLNSPTINKNSDANYIPHGVIQHSDILTGRPPHSNETSFVLLSNLWFSKIPVVFNVKDLQIESKPRGVTIKYKDENSKSKTISGVKRVGLGTGPGEQKLHSISYSSQESKLREIMIQTASAPGLQTKGLYTTLDFLNAANKAQSSKELLPHEIVIVGHAHSAYTVAESILQLWEKFPERFKQKPKIKLIGAKLSNSEEFFEDVRSSSVNPTKQEIFVNRYKHILPKYFDDKTIVGIDGHAGALEQNANGSIEMQVSNNDGRLTVQSPLVVLASGQDSNYLNIIGDKSNWKEMNAWALTIPPHSLPQEKAPHDELRPISQRFQVTGHSGQLWLYGGANPLLNQFAEPNFRNATITGSPRSINVMGPQIEALGRILSGDLEPEMRETERTLHPGSSLLLGF